MEQIAISSLGNPAWGMKNKDMEVESQTSSYRQVLFLVLHCKGSLSQSAAANRFGKNAGSVSSFSQSLVGAFCLGYIMNLLFDSIM